MLLILHLIEKNVKDSILFFLLNCQVKLNTLHVLENECKWPINQREFAYDLYESALLGKKWNIGKIFIYLQKSRKTFKNTEEYQKEKIFAYGQSL